MSSQPSGVNYLWSYPGGLKIIEEILALTVLIGLGCIGYNLQGYLLNTFAVLSLICTGTLIIFHLYDITRKSKLPWHWIECVYVLICAISYAILASVTFSVFTKGYIAIGIVGYVLAMVYFFDTFDKYQRAIAPTPKYAWTTPNMPDLN